MLASDIPGLDEDEELPQPGDNFVVWVTVCSGRTRWRSKFCCGDGHHSVKWLANSACARFAASRAPRGSLRVREPRGIPWGGANYIPVGVTSETCSFHHPDSLLYEAFATGSEVAVVVGNPRYTDAIGGADYGTASRWAEIAFHQSPPKMPAKHRALVDEVGHLPPAKRQGDMIATRE